MKFRLFLRSFDNDLIQAASKELIQALAKTDCKLSGVIALPIRIKRFCVLRSPHVNKDSREHFELRLYKRFLDIQTQSFHLLEHLIKVDLPSGVSCSLKILETE